MIIKLSKDEDGDLKMVFTCGDDEDGIELETTIPSKHITRVAGSMITIAYGLHPPEGITIDLKRGFTEEENQVCSNCGHSLIDNDHGPDQNDFEVNESGAYHTGSCTYCKECNPRLKEAPNAG